MTLARIWVGIPILATLIVVFAGHSAFAQVGFETANLQCLPVVVSNCGCGQVPNPKGGCMKGDNKYQCVCTQVNNGYSQVGTCAASGECKDLTTGGKSPSSVTPQQLKAANNGTSANGATAQPGSSSGGSAQVSSNPGISTPAPSSQQSSNQSTPSNQNSSATPGPGNSTLLSAYQWLTGESGTAPQDIGGNPIGSNGNSQLASQPSWLDNVQQYPQYQLQSDVPGPALQAEQSATPVDNSAPPVNPGFNVVSTPEGKLGPSDAEIQQANSVTLSPLQQAVQDARAIERGVADTAGSWVQSTFYPTAQEALAAPQLSPQDISDVRATIYTPGAGGIDGGMIGSRDNYLNPNIPTVAAGFSSPYQYGEVLSIRNPDTGQTVNAVVGDTCPACGSGIDLTPAAANSIGFTEEQGVGNMQVAVVASTGSYTAGAQLASSLNSPPDPWAGSSASFASIPTSSLPGVATVNDYADAALASTQYTNDQIASANTSEAVSDSGNLAAVPSGNVETSALQPVQPTGEQIAQSWAENTAGQNGVYAQLQDRLAQAEAETNTFNNPAMPSITADLPNGEAITQRVFDSAVASAANQPQPTLAEGTGYPSDVVQQGPELGQPYPSGTIESSPLAQPLTDDQIVEAWNGNTFAQNAEYLAGQQVNSVSEPLAANSTERPTINTSPATEGEQTQSPAVPTTESPEVTTVPIQTTESPEVTTAPTERSGSNTAMLADVTNADRTFTAFNPDSLGDAGNGTVIGSDLLNPGTLKLGAASYNSDVTQDIAIATQFSQPLPGSEVQLPQDRPVGAGPTGIDMSGCGGVCEVGNTGADVKAIQSFLTSQGYNAGPADGVYGSQTKNAVQDFQQDHNIAVDGIVGPQTVGVMNQLATEDHPAAREQTSPAPQTSEVNVTQAQGPTNGQASASGQAEVNANQGSANQTTSVLPDENANPGQSGRTYTLSNAGDLRGEFLVNPVTAAFTPDSIKQELQNAYDNGADTITLTRSQLDSVRWDLMDSNQLTQIQNILGPTGYQIPTSAFSAQPPGMQDIFNMQQATADASALRACWTGFCY